MSRNYSELFDQDEVEMLQDMDNVITKLDLWDWMKSCEPQKGFMFTTDPNLNRIISNLSYGGHSGGSYAWTMRMMEDIAKKGWNDFRYEHLAENQLEKTEEFNKLNELLNSARLSRDIKLENYFEKLIEKEIKQLANELKEKDITPMTVAESLQNVLSDGKKQYQAMKEFSEGKITYAQMRGLCG